MVKLYDIRFESGEIAEAKSSAEIKALIVEGDLTANGQIRKTGDGSWHKVSNIDSLASTLNAQKDSINKMDAGEKSTNSPHGVEALETEATFGLDTEASSHTVTPGKVGELLALADTGQVETELEEAPTEVAEETVEEAVAKDETKKDDVQSEDTAEKVEEESNDFNISSRVQEWIDQPIESIIQEYEKE